MLRTLLEHEITVQPSLTKLPDVLVNVTYQFTTCLLKMTVPTFFGNLLWGSFSAVIYSNSLLTGVHKFNYHRAQVTDEATKTLLGFH